MKLLIYKLENVVTIIIIVIIEINEKNFLITQNRFAKISLFKRKSILFQTFND